MSSIGIDYFKSSRWRFGQCSLIQERGVQNNFKKIHPLYPPSPNSSPKNVRNLYPLLGYIILFYSSVFFQNTLNLYKFGNGELKHNYFKIFQPPKILTQKSCPNVGPNARSSLRMTLSIYLAYRQSTCTKIMHNLISNRPIWPTIQEINHGNIIL